MQICFKKGRNKPDTLSVQRQDGSVTWSQGQAGPAYHDLAHYAVETVLHCRQAFFGILKQGYAIDDFVKPRPLRPEALKPSNLPAEAMQVEYVVSRLQLEHVNGAEDDDFLPSLRQTLAERNLPFPELLTQPALTRIRERYRALVTEWNALPPGQTLTLPFAD